MGNRRKKQKTCNIKSMPEAEDDMSEAGKRKIEDDLVLDLLRHATTGDEWKAEELVS